MIESVLLRELFDRLNESGIRYAVLRNYESLPQSLGGSDLDLLVSRDRLQDAYQIVDRVARLNGGCCISCIDDFKITVINSRFCGKEINNSHWWGMPIDIFATVGLRQYEYFESSAVLANSLVYRNILVASPGDAAIIAFLKECLANGKSRKGYEKDAATAYVTDEPRYRKILGEYFGTKVGRLWGKYLMDGRDERILRQISRRARWALRIHTFLRNPYRAFQDTSACTWRRLVRLFQPPGFSVVFTGADGSGKSTIIQGIEPVMQAALHKIPKYEHLRPNLLPSIAKLFGRNAATGPVTDPHASSQSGFIGSLLRLFYYSLDYILGYWFKVYPTLVRKQNLYVFDRYYYDYLIDPRRSRIRLPRWIIKAVLFFIPEPNLILCLGADPAVIHARKPELPLGEVARQVAELKRFCGSNKRAVWIDTGCPIEDSIDQALEAITSRMAARYDKKSQYR
jgi:thymidylate kinase